jgi:hypothetical protein
MTTVLIFEHRGVGSAMPAEQAMSALGRSAEEHELVQLWAGHPADETCTLLVRSGIGPVGFACSTPRLVRVPRAELRALSPLLRQSLADMPYIVGAAWLDETPLWLLDMSRFFGAEAARIGNRNAQSAG